MTSSITRRAATAAAAAVAVASPAPAVAQTAITFDGTVVQSCILALSTPGTLGTNANGTELGSEQTLGAAATMTVVATAGTPTLSFTAPTMSARPAAYTGTPTVSTKYTSTGGANQAYTSGSFSYTSSNALGDTVTINAKAADAAGFAAGSYRVQTTATCQQ